MSKTVVLIDDDQDDLEFLKEAIASIDASILCICFISPVEAIRVISHELLEKPEYIFTDINMPGMSGEQVVRELRIRREFDHTVIAVLSTTIPAHVSDRLKSIGADHTFQKPIQIAGYADVIRNIFKTKRTTASGLLQAGS
jgi:CheY-like chemotaxis protein